MPLAACLSCVLVFLPGVWSYLSRVAICFRIYIPSTVLLFFVVRRAYKTSEEKRVGSSIKTREHIPLLRLFSGHLKFVSELFP